MSTEQLAHMRRNYTRDGLLEELAPDQPARHHDARHPMATPNSAQVQRNRRHHIG